MPEKEDSMKDVMVKSTIREALLILHGAGTGESVHINEQTSGCLHWISQVNMLTVDGFPQWAVSFSIAACDPGMVEIHRMMPNPQGGLEPVGTVEKVDISNINNYGDLTEEICQTVIEWEKTYFESIGSKGVH